MDTFVLITLIVILLLFVYFLYYWVYSTKKVLTTTVVDLTKVNSALSDLKEPGNTRYAYAAWIFVNDLDPNVDNVVFYRKNNICIYFDKTSKLNCSIAGTGANATNITTTITDTFPLQRWVHILVSVDGQYIDYYLNGKLIKSEKKSYIPTTPAGYGADLKTVDVPVYLGNSGVSAAGNPKDATYASNGNNAGYKAFLTKFTRWTTPLDPQSVWNEYTSGNGGAYFPYSVRLDLLKNNNIESSYQMW